MKTPISRVVPYLLVIRAIGVIGLPNPAAAQENALPKYLSDRGIGVSTSLFGTYIGRGQLLFYPSLAYTFDHNQEYRPAGLGFGLDQTFPGKYRASEGVIFVGYGLTDRLALELEAALIRATFEKSTNDPSATPARIEESGFGDVEGQLRFRWMSESDHRPEVFSYLEVTAPSQKRKLVIGAPDWDVKPGIGITRGFSWGTVTVRSCIEYTREDSSLNVGETAVEYLKRLSPSSRLYLGIEGGEGGGPDEWVLITGVQWRLTDFAVLKLSNALGIMPKSTDWAPELGIIFSSTPFGHP